MTGKSRWSRTGASRARARRHRACVREHGLEVLLRDQRLGQFGTSGPLYLNTHSGRARRSRARTCCVVVDDQDRMSHESTGGDEAPGLGTGR